MYRIIKRFIRQQRVDLITHQQFGDLFNDAAQISIWYACNLTVRKVYLTIFTNFFLFCEIIVKVFFAINWFIEICWIESAAANRCLWSLDEEALKDLITFNMISSNRCAIVALHSNEKLMILSAKRPPIRWKIKWVISFSKLDSASEVAREIVS